MVVVSGSVAFFTLLSGSQPLGQRWLSHTLDLYAESSVDLYKQGGQSQLEKYLDHIRNSGVDATLIDPQGRDLPARGIPPGAKRAYDSAKARGESRFFTGWAWTGAAVPSCL